MFVMIAALALMVAGTLVTIQTRSIWGLYIFAGAAGLYILARLATFGLLASWTSALGLLLLAVGCSLLSRWRPPSLPGIAGIACLAASAVCIALFVRTRVRAAKKPLSQDDSASPP